VLSPTGGPVGCAGVGPVQAYFEALTQAAGRTEQLPPSPQGLESGMEHPASGVDKIVGHEMHLYSVIVFGEVPQVTA
jgi:hypothetical protein